MVWKAGLEAGNESKKIKYEIVPYTRGKVLDIGCGPWKAFPHFIGIDSKMEWDDREWHPDITLDGTDLSIFKKESMDAVYSSHLLEHLEYPGEVLKEWWRVIKVGGHLVLYLPHKEFYPNRGQKGANTSHLHDFLPEDIIKFMEFGGWDLLINEDRNNDDEYSFFQVYRKRNDKEQNRKYLKKKNLGNTCAVSRYGGIGDMIMVSSLFPALKEQGYHITLYTAPIGYELLKTDPNVDKIIIQDKDQVPNIELFDYWEVIKKKYDKWVNLSESIEATLLVIPSRPLYYYPQWARHYLLDINYLDFTHVVAGLQDFPKRPRFYPTSKEKEWAERQRKAINGRVIVWSLSGSSIHKSYPYMDKVIAKILLEYPDVYIVMVGDDVSVILETFWENEKRVIRTSGNWSIRQTLAFAEKADLVIGPETGVMNAMGMTNVPKIVFLSHSSVNNLTRDWVNTISLIPENCPCYPCHQMHYGYDDYGCVRHDDPNITEEFKKQIDIYKTCRVDQMPKEMAIYLGTWTGAPLCTALIKPEKVWSEIKKILG